MSRCLWYSKMQYVSTRGFHLLSSSHIFGHTSFLFYVICILVLCYLEENLLEHLENVLPLKHFGNANLTENFILRLRKNIPEPSPEFPVGMLTFPCYQLFPFKSDLHNMWKACFWDGAFPPFRAAILTWCDPAEGMDGLLSEYQWEVCGGEKPKLPDLMLWVLS